MAYLDCAFIHSTSSLTTFRGWRTLRSLGACAPGASKRGHALQCPRVLVPVSRRICGRDVARFDTRPQFGAPAKGRGHWEACLTRYNSRSTPHQRAAGDLESGKEPKKRLDPERGTSERQSAREAKSAVMFFNVGGWEGSGTLPPPALSRALTGRYSPTLPLSVSESRFEGRAPPV